MSNYFPGCLEIGNAEYVIYASQSAGSAGIRGNEHSVIATVLWRDDKISAGNADAWAALEAVSRRNTFTNKFERNVLTPISHCFVCSKDIHLGRKRRLRSIMF